MSISLVEHYESEEEIQPVIFEDSDEEAEDVTENLHDGDADLGGLNGPATTLAALVAPRKEKASTSLLPSVADAFTEVSGPPEFLHPAALMPIPGIDAPRRPSGRGKYDLDYNGAHPSATLEAKPQLVGMGVRSQAPPPKTSDPARGGAAGNGHGREEAGDGKRKNVAGMPPSAEVARLASVCEKCHVPKVASAARGGLVCPLCSDRQPAQGLVESDKKKGVVKDKEKNKRMKGQSSHATWKSETEMQLRQHYD